MKQRITTCLFLLFLILTGLSLTGCEKADDFKPAPRENFEALWKILDEHYCFFEYKDIDWNEVHDRYSVQVQDTMNQFQFFDLMGKMLAELKDGHTNLVSSFNMSRYWAWYEDYPVNFNQEIHKKYMGTDYLIAGGLKYKRMAEDQIGYVYYSSFSSGVGQSNLDYMFLHFKDCKGLIIDVRENGGGSLTYSDVIAARFMEEKKVMGYMRYKTGARHSDFSEPYPLELEPSNRIRWMRPVIVLTNRHCFSAANDFVSKMRTLPQVTILGDRTGGGSGFPFSSELPNGWSVRFSACPMLDADKQDTEFGIDPDIRVSMTEADMARGKDTLIDQALLRLLIE